VSVLWIGLGLRLTVSVGVSCPSGASATIYSLRMSIMSLISCVLNADSGRYADALISYTLAVLRFAEFRRQSGSPSARI